MSIYRLRVKCNNAQVEVVAKNGTILAREMDRYLESFLGRKISTNYEQPVQQRYTQPQTEYSAPQMQDFTIDFKPAQQVHQQTQNTNTAAENFNTNFNVPALNEFIASNKGYDTFSEFIISAYYMKKVLNNEFFTLKMLNSKFYPATGSLVDFYIIEEAKNKGFINTWNDEGTTKYTLNEEGEAYFINQLRG